MRALIGLGLLLAAFALAASWQESQTRALRRQRDLRRSQPILASASGLDEGWNLLVVGRPSGVDPLPYPELGWATGNELARGLGLAPAAQDAGGSGAERPGLLSADSAGEAAQRPSGLDASGEPGTEGEFVYRIQAGDSLGEICAGHYGSARPALVRAVAAYNDLASADAIREGELLYLPDPSRL